MDKVLAQFLSVAEKGSITAAAAALSIAQPSLTGNIKRLEATLGVPLFERSARGVTLTRYGRTLYESVDVMQRLYENALQAIERQRIEKEEGLSLGSGYSWWSLYLKDFVLDYCARHPEASVNVVLGSALRCMDQLVAGDIVFSIGDRLVISTSASRSTSSRSVRCETEIMFGSAILFSQLPEPPPRWPPTPRFWPSHRRRATRNCCSAMALARLRRTCPSMSDTPSPPTRWRLVSILRAARTPF